MSNPVQSDSTPAPAPVARSSSGSSSGSSLKSPRTARFAEATTVVSPIGPSESGQSPFADPPAMAESQHHISDVGFGYVADNDASRHVSHPPLSPASPLKSALKSPGTARTLNPLSPTFREELNLEKQEKKTERENARDLVSLEDCTLPKASLPMLTGLPENQSPSPAGQGASPLRQLQLQSDRALTHRDHFIHLQRHQGPSAPQQSAPVGNRDESMAADSLAGARQYFAIHLPGRLVVLLARGPPTRGESRGVLFRVFGVFLYFQRRHVGGRGRPLPECQSKWEWPGPVGLVVQPEYTGPALSG